MTLRYIASLKLISIFLPQFEYSVRYFTQDLSDAPFIVLCKPLREPKVILSGVRESNKRSINSYYNTNSADDYFRADDGE